MKADGDGPTEGTSLLDYVATIKRRKHVVLLAVVLVPVAAVAASFFQHPLYRASAKVLVSQQSIAQSVAGVTDPAAGQDPQRTLQTQADLAHITAIVQRVRRAAHVSLTVEQLMKACSVTPKANSNLLVFACDDAAPAVAGRLATTYAQQYAVYRHQLDTGPLVRERRDVAAQVARLDAAGGPAVEAERATLVEKLQQLRTVIALQTSNVAVVQLATNATQVAPRPVRNGFLGLLLGAVVGVGLVFLLEALDTRVQSTDEVERLLGLPLLARIPEPPRWLQRMGQLVMAGDPNGAHAEPFRVLRTNLDFFNLERGARTIMITSAVEQEGKSTTISNLALALTRAGQRVVLVDLDLRRPTLARTFGVEGAVGFTDIAQGRARLEPADVDELGAHPGETSGRLDILTTGSLPADTGDFIESDALPRVLRQLREHADIVLIDCPPLLPVGDALSLAAKVDAMIVVTRLGVVRRPMLKELRRTIDSVPAAKLGVVVTGADLDQTYPYAYGGYYRSYTPNSPEARR